VPTRPRVLHFDVTVDATGDAQSALGGSPIPKEDEWWPEHLVLAGLVRCTLASMDYAARRAELESEGTGKAHGTVTKRGEDGLHAFVTIETTLEVSIAPAPDAATLAELVAKAEHGCFVSNSLTARPRHRWIVNGEEIA
jgi:organic hydroperoxide reductase OsmC/OhrA